jgi:hypothetical protein
MRAISRIQKGRTSATSEHKMPFVADDFSHDAAIMKPNLIHVVVPLLLAGSVLPTRALDPATTPGRWRVGYLDTPDGLGLQRNASSEVVNVLHRTFFDNGAGYVDVAGDGSFSGVVGTPVSGAMNLSTDGIGTTSTGETFYFNDNGDFATSVSSDSTGWLTLQCMVRAPATIPAGSAVAGRWNVIGMEVPYMLDQTLVDGIVTNLAPLNGFGQEAGYVDIDAMGGFTGFVGEPVTGTAALGAEGAVTSALFSPGQVFRLNQSTDVMVAFNDEGPGQYYRSFYAMLKAPASLAAHELQGRWNVVAVTTPDALVLNKNTSNRVIDVFGESSFHNDSGYIDVSSTGTITGNVGGPVNATASITGTGVVTVNDSSGPITVYVNAGKDVMMGVTNEPGSPSPGLNQVLIMVRATVPRVITLSYAAADMTFCWPDDGAVKLQRSTDLLNWADVVTTNACHTEPLSSGKAFFKLVPGP